MSPERAPVVRVSELIHRYSGRTALNRVSVEIRSGQSLALIGPDGVGKSTLLGIIAGARKIQSGKVEVLGADMARRRDRRRVCSQIAYMPQGLGKNLYASLTVVENLDFFGRLFGHPPKERCQRIEQLLAATGLAPFSDRAVGKLSGGMRQKLGLCCALIHDPDLLILDEPTTGVDPLSRQQFWELIDRIRNNRPTMNLIVATAYMEEAERFDQIVAMNDGYVMAAGTPDELRSKTRTDSLERTFVALLPEGQGGRRHAMEIPPLEAGDGEPAIVAEGLTCRFGDFTAVDHVSFRIERGEIFGFLGSNGCGKTTTMKVLTGLLAASEGRAWLFGQPADASTLETRKRVGYMSQTFSLYAELTVRQNLDLHARLFHLPKVKIPDRIARLIAEFGLATFENSLVADLPLGVRQRLSLAVAVIHEPEMLILDEPTSGVDPIARDTFWELLVDLSRNQGVTIFISTHFMNEATRCDRVSLMHAGRVLASGTPAALCAERGAPTLEQAFVGFLQGALGEQPESEGENSPGEVSHRPLVEDSRFVLSIRRLLAYSYREALEIWRDPIRLSVALLGTILLMLIFGYGITTDVENLPYAALDRDQTLASRTYLENFAGSRYFVERAPISSPAELERRLQSNKLSLAIEIPQGFGRDLARGHPTEVAVWIDGAMPFRSETIRGYVQGIHQHFLQDMAMRMRGVRLSPLPADLEVRFRYNQDFKSIYAMVPAVIALLLIFIPAILMALGVVREKELGSIINFYVTPVSRFEFLLGKQLPYIALSMANFFSMTAIAVFLFGVPLKGSLVGLTVGALLYVISATGIGLVISAFTRTQIAALFGTAIMTIMPATQFSGMLQPVSSLEGPARVLGQIIPTTYFLKICVGSFTKALSFTDLIPFFLPLAAFIPVLMLLSVVVLRKQDR